MNRSLSSAEPNTYQLESYMFKNRYCEYPKRAYIDILVLDWYIGTRLTDWYYIGILGIGKSHVISTRWAACTF